MIRPQNQPTSQKTFTDEAKLESIEAEPNFPSLRQWRKGDDVQAQSEFVVSRPGKTSVMHSMSASLIAWMVKKFTLTGPQLSSILLVALIMLLLCVTSDLRSRKWTLSSPREASTVGHGWNLYVVDTVSPLTLYQEMVRQTNFLWSVVCLSTRVGFCTSMLISHAHIPLCVCTCVRLNTVSGMQRPTHRPKASGTSSVKLTFCFVLLYSKPQCRNRTVRVAPRPLCTQMWTNRQTGEIWRKHSGRTVHSWETVSAGQSHTHIPLNNLIMMESTICNNIHFTCAKWWAPWI